MDKEINSENGEDLKSKPVVSEITYPKKSIADIDHRLKNIEKMTGVVKDIAYKAIDAWDENRNRKAESEREERTLRNEQHKRMGWILIGVIFLIFTLCVIAMVVGQYDLVKLILSSTLALTAGVGLTSFVQKKKDEK